MKRRRHTDVQINLYTALLDLHRLRREKAQFSDEEVQRILGRAQIVRRQVIGFEGQCVFRRILRAVWAGHLGDPHRKVMVLAPV